MNVRYRIVPSLDLFLLLLASILIFQAPARCEEQTDWLQRVRLQVAAQHLDLAMLAIDQRIAQKPDDLEARGRKARLLAWQGQWMEAQWEYEYVLGYAPGDVEILGGLADVLLWQGKAKDALAVIDRARSIAPTQPDILLRRARILRSLDDISAARRQYHEILQLGSNASEVSGALGELASENRYELRIGADASTFNYTGGAESEIMSFRSRWTPRISSVVETSFNQRFGQSATKFSGSSSLLVAKRMWLSLGGAVANSNIIIPEHELQIEVGQGFTLSNTFIKGLEASFQQHWFWYEGAHVLTLGATQLYYLPKEWSWSLSLTAARSSFTGAGIQWSPSGCSRLNFPIRRGVSGNVMFANGTENFAAIDQIGHFSARTFAGGLKFRYSGRQDISGYVALQKRSQERTQNSFGMSYGLHF
jgi:hypothetical protein